jgi:hypothetical protein
MKIATFSLTITLGDMFVGHDKTHHLRLLISFQFLFEIFPCPIQNKLEAPDKGKMKPASKLQEV